MFTNIHQPHTCIATTCVVATMPVSAEPQAPGFRLGLKGCSLCVSAESQPLEHWVSPRSRITRFLAHTQTTSLLVVGKLPPLINVTAPAVLCCVGRPSSQEGVSGTTCGVWGARDRSVQQHISLVLAWGQVCVRQVFVS